MADFDLFEQALNEYEENENVKVKVDVNVKDLEDIHFEICKHLNYNG